MMNDAIVILNDFETIGLSRIMARARDIRDEGKGKRITFSRKVFIPLTRLCRDVCGYCTFATTPSRLENAYLSPDQVLEIARAGKRAGCHEALFTLGDKPEKRYAVAREFLATHGYGSTLEYLKAMCSLVLRETGLLPHVNAGMMTAAEMEELREVSVSQGLMLESLSPRLCEPGGAHYGSPDKHPAVRMAMIETAGRLRIPFTSGILIGIGESRLERVESLLALKSLHDSHGHLQEIIIQNFRAKPSTRMASSADAEFDDLLWTVSAARIIFGGTTNIQVPPNLSYDDFPRLLEAGINDWGGISPVTIDHVNPEAPWPDLLRLATETENAGFVLAERLAVYPSYLEQEGAWFHKDVLHKARQVANSLFLAREDDWCPGGEMDPPSKRPSRQKQISSIDQLIVRASLGDRLVSDDIVKLFNASGQGVDEVCDAANDLRRCVKGDDVSYVVTRNINYTNVCYFGCKFCAFSKGSRKEELGGSPYDLSLDEVGRRASEAWDRGATEVCMQGGINPGYNGNTYLSLLRAVKEAAPKIHVHAFSPLEIAQGAETMGLSVRRYLALLQEAGLGSLPGTAAEILDDDVRAVICPDKLNTAQWLDVVKTAHDIGFKTTATIMFGHVEGVGSWAKHLLQVRDLQSLTGGFTEFVPLPFVHMEAPMYLRGSARRGPTWDEVRLMHAVARLVLHPGIDNIQVSWVKAGPKGAAFLLNGGANDLGGTLMNESISKAAGTTHGQELNPAQMESLIRGIRRKPWQRTTLYGRVGEDRHAASLEAAELLPIIQTPVGARRSRLEVR